MSNNKKEFIHHLKSIVFLASVMVVLSSMHLMKGLDALFLYAANTDASQEVCSEIEDNCLPKALRPVLIDINDYAFENLFGLRSPLDREHIYELLKPIIAPTGSANNPNVVAVDLDLSPVPNEQKAIREKLDLLLDCNRTDFPDACKNHPKIILIQPFPSSSQKLVADDIEWMKKRCEAGVEFASPNLLETMGVVVEQYKTADSLAHQAWLAEEKFRNKPRHKHRYLLADEHRYQHENKLEHKRKPDLKYKHEHKSKHKHGHEHEEKHDLEKMRKYEPRDNHEHEHEVNHEHRVNHEHEHTVNHEHEQDYWLSEHKHKCSIPTESICDRIKDIKFDERGTIIKGEDATGFLRLHQIHEYTRSANIREECNVPYQNKTWDLSEPLLLNRDFSINYDHIDFYRFESLEKPPIPLNERVVFVGGTYGLQDRFETSFGNIAGIKVHVAEYYSRAKPIGNYKPLVVISEIVLGFAFAYLLSWMWKQYFYLKQHPNQGVRDGASFIAWSILFIIILIFYAMIESIAWLLREGLWLNPTPLILGLFADSVLTGIESNKGDARLKKITSDYTLDDSDSGVCFWLSVPHYCPKYLKWPVDLILIPINIINNIVLLLIKPMQHIVRVFCSIVNCLWFIVANYLWPFCMVIIQGCCNGNATIFAQKITGIIGISIQYIGDLFMIAVQGYSKSVSSIRCIVFVGFLVYATYYLVQYFYT